MKYVVGLVTAIALCTGGDLLACGDKFLVAGRGTRYQRPKSARAASVLIYAEPGSGFQTALGDVPLEPVLKREGHRSTTVETLEQLSAIVAGGRFDVVLVASSVVAAVEQLLGRGPGAPVVVAFCPNAGSTALQDGGRSITCAVRAPAKERTLLEAIDKAVEQHDRNVRRTATLG